MDAADQHLVDEVQRAIARARSAGPERAVAELAALTALAERISGDERPLAQKLWVGLQETRAVLLSATGDPSGQLAAADAVVARFHASEDLKLVQGVCWGLLVRVAVSVEAGREADAGHAARELLAVFERQPDEQDLTGIGTMLLDAGHWLISRDWNDVALTVCDGVSRRLGEEDKPSRQVTAARAQLAAFLTLGRLGRTAEARERLESLVRHGELALAAIDQTELRLREAGAAPAVLAALAELRGALAGTVSAS